MKILFATQNKGKQKEINQLFSDSQELLFPEDLGLSQLDVEESGASFKKNAFLKASAFAKKANMLSVADDSGLSVEALDGLPGVHSDRYFPGTASEKNIALLKKLEKKSNRSATFSSTLCLYNPNTKKAEYFVGVVEGQIAKEIRGNKGFGYDPVFIPEGSKKTWGELGPEEKNKDSHRAIALKKLKDYVQTT